MISVIVPVYNVEKYLRKCIDSILSQTYKDYEIILVDDGSTDSSGKICDEYAKKNKKIIVIHKPNGGLSDARNKGIEKAKGEYITYVDSDDWIDKDFLKNLYNLIIDKNADMAVGGVEFVFENENNKITPETKVETGSFPGLIALEKMLQGTLADHGTSACGIIYKSELSKKYKFPYGKYHEDDFTTFNYYKNSNMVAFTNEKLYFYLQRNNSIMHKEFGQSFIDELDSADYLVNECKNLNSNIRNYVLLKQQGNYLDVILKYPNLNKINFNVYNRINKTIKIITNELRKTDLFGKKYQIFFVLTFLFGIKVSKNFYYKFL